MSPLRLRLRLRLPDWMPLPLPVPPLLEAQRLRLRLRLRLLRMSLRPGRLPVGVAPQMPLRPGWLLKLLPLPPVEEILVLP